MLTSYEMKELMKLQREYNLRRSRILDEIDRRKYYEGFKVGREKKMFQEELKDLEVAYKNTLLKYEEEVEDCLPALIHYMEKFVNLHKKNEALREKLDTLLAKIGESKEEEDDE